MSSTYDIKAGTSLSSPGIFLLGNQILQTRFMTLLADYKGQPELEKQMLASGIAQIFAHIKRGYHQIEASHFYLILVGLGSSDSQRNKDLIINIRNDYFRQIKSEEDKENQQTSFEIDFFNILSFQDIKSCQSFFHQKSLCSDEKLSESPNFQHSLIHPSGSENLLPSGDRDDLCPEKNRLLFDTKDLHLFFLFGEKVLKEEYSEQTVFTESLFNNEFNNYPDSKNSIPDKCFQNDSCKLSSLWQTEKNFACPNCQKIINNYVNIFGIGKAEKNSEIEHQVRASIIYTTSISDLYLYPSSDIIIIPRIDASATNHSDIFIKASPENIYGLYNDISLAEEDEMEMNATFDPDQTMALRGFQDMSQESNQSEMINREQDWQETIGDHPVDAKQENNPGQAQTMDATAKNGQSVIFEQAPEKSPITVFVSSEAEYTPLCIGLLGPIRITGSYFNFAHSPRLSELVVYLSLHPEGVNSTTWATALWPDRRVPTQTIANRLSETRRALGIASDNKPRLRKIADKHFIADIVVDWFLFKNLSSDSSPLKNCREALKLIQGRPLSGIAQGQWISLEGFQTEIEEAIVNCALRVGKWYLGYHDPEHALWAAMQGLKANPFDERLYRLQMHSYDMLGNRVGIEEILMNISSVLEIKGDPLKSIHPKTASLYKVLTGKTS